MNMLRNIFAFVSVFFVLISGTRSSEFDSDTNLTPLEFAIKNGYPSEQHNVESKDGYILGLHRIRFGKSGPGDEKRIPILIHHGLLSSSIDWVIQGPDKSLGYRLADDGYDVWLSNARGNKFSRSHITYNSKQEEFWNYSFHEMGLYDLPASIDHILNVTGHDQLIYIGYSMGTTVFYVMASTLPEYNKKIKFHISLAPVAAISNTNLAYALLVPSIEKMLTSYIRGIFLRNDWMTAIIMNFFNGLLGMEPDQFNTEIAPIISQNFPAGTSSKTLIHCLQLINSDTFSQYDYGKDENIKRYGFEKPPNYNIGKIKVPLRIYYSENDPFSNPTDTKLLYQKIRKPLGLQRINSQKFSHLDFIWAKNINQQLNDDIIEFINNSTDRVNGTNFIKSSIRQALQIKTEIL